MSIPFDALLDDLLDDPLDGLLDDPLGEPIGAPSGAALHGGPDSQGAPRWDFSTNANACGPEPLALRAVRSADPTRYPDPASTRLRRALGALHGVDPQRIVVAASASEFIVRLSTAVALRRPGAAAWWPRPGYGDYARAAGAVGLRPAAHAAQAHLVWHTQPGSPLGLAQPLPTGLRDDALAVVDLAYADLQLEGDAPACPAHAWRLHSPNKALGLTGVRGAYAIAPEGAAAQGWLDALHGLAPSWPVGAHGQAMLMAWSQPACQAWVRDSLAVLRVWKAAQLQACLRMGWRIEPSVAPFFTAALPDWSILGEGRLAGLIDTDTEAKNTQHTADHTAQLLRGLRELGVKLRDTASMGWPGGVRLGVRPPPAQQALERAWAMLTERAGRGANGSAVVVAPTPAPTPAPAPASTPTPTPTPTPTRAPTIKGPQP